MLSGLLELSSKHAEVRKGENGLAEIVIKQHLLDYSDAFATNMCN